MEWHSDQFELIMMSGSKTIYVGLAQKKAKREEELKLQFSKKHDRDHSRKTPVSVCLGPFWSYNICGENQRLRSFFSYAFRVQMFM